MTARVRPKPGQRHMVGGSAVIVLQVGGSTLTRGGRLGWACRVAPELGVTAGKLSLGVAYWATLEGRKVSS